MRSGGHARAMIAEGLLAMHGLLHGNVHTYNITGIIETGFGGAALFYAKWAPPTPDVPSVRPQLTKFVLKVKKPTDWFFTHGDSSRAKPRTRQPNRTRLPGQQCQPYADLETKINRIVGERQTQLGTHGCITRFVEDFAYGPKCIHVEGKRAAVLLPCPPRDGVRAWRSVRVRGQVEAALLSRRLQIRLGLGRLRHVPRRQEGGGGHRRVRARERVAHRPRL